VTSTSQSYPMPVSMAVLILQARICNPIHTNQAKIIPGAHWVQRSLSRHPDVKVKYCQYLEKVRAKVTATVGEKCK